MSRKLKHLALLLSLLWLTIGALSAESIVGSWVQDQVETRWTFRADGTGFMETGQPKVTARFNWALSSDGQTLRVSTAGTMVPYQVVQNDGSNLVIVNQRVSQTYQLRRQ